VDMIHLFILFFKLFQPSKASTLPLIITTANGGPGEILIDRHKFRDWTLKLSIFGGVIPEFDRERLNRVPVTQGQLSKFGRNTNQRLRF